MNKETFMNLHIECTDERDILSNFKTLLEKAQKHFQKDNAGQFSASSEHEYGDYANILAYKNYKDEYYLSLYISAEKGGHYCSALNLDYPEWEDDDELREIFEENMKMVLFGY